MKASNSNTQEKKQPLRRNEEPPISLRTHIIVAFAICAAALIASYTGLIPGGRQSIDKWTDIVRDGVTGLFGESKVSFDNVCSGNGILVSNNQECFCDVGYVGSKCEVSLKDSPASNNEVKPNSVLLVTDAFGSLVSSQTASTSRASVVDVAVAHDAASYERLAYELVGQSIDVTVLYVGEPNIESDKRFQAIKAQLAADKITLKTVSEVPVSVGPSTVTRQAYAVYRYLVSPSNNVYATIQAPSRSGLLYYVLQARRQGLACFDRTSFVTHLDSLPRALLERLENNDPEGLLFGSTYGGSEAQVAEILKSDYMSQKVAEWADGVVVSSQVMIDYAKNELKWALNEENIRVVQEVPAVAAQSKSSSPNAELELVFVGTPYLSASSGVKIVADALDLLKGRVSASSRFHITFLGQGVELPNPKLTTDEFLDLRAYNWPAAEWQVVPVSSLQEMVNYFSAEGKTRKIAIVPHILSSTGSSYLLQTLISNKIPVFSARSALAEGAVLYDDWGRTFFQSNNSKSLADKLIAIIKAGAVEPARLNFDFSVEPVVSWIDHVYAGMFAMAKNGGMCSKNVFDSTLNPESNLPLVSIVIVHHNRVEFLKQALRSIESQSYPAEKLEVILVDDGSTDPQAVQFINDLAWQWWENQGWKVIREPQRWLGAARNTGVKYAKGEYVMFLDDDDVAKHLKVEVMVKVAMNAAADVVTSGHDVFTSQHYPQTTATAGAFGRFVPVGSASLVGMFQNVFGDSSFLARRTFFVEFGGFTEDFGVGFEDYEFLAKVALDPQARLESVPESLTWYRKLSEGRSMTENTELKQNQGRMMRPYVSSYPFQSAQEQSLLRFAQDRLFARAKIDNPFSSALLNTTVDFTSTTTIATVISTQAATSVVATTARQTSTVIPTQTPGGPSCIYDICGVCNGDGQSCVDCHNVTFGPSVPDRCGVCDGDGTTCFKLTDIQPNPIPNRGGIGIALFGAGFTQGDKVVIHGQVLPDANVVVLSSGVISCTLTSIPPWSNDFVQNANLTTNSYRVYVDNGVDRTGDVLLTVYRETSQIASVSPTSAILSPNPITVNIIGTGFLAFSNIRCWFSYTELDWNDDFTALVYVKKYQSTVAVYMSDSFLTCPGPILKRSSDVDVDVSYSGLGYDPYVDGDLTYQFANWIFLAKAPGVVTLTIRFSAPAPVITNTYMSDDGFLTYVEFDSDTNGFALPSSKCSDLFVVDPNAANIDNTTYAKLSDGVKDDCSFFFEDPKVLAVSVSADVAANNPNTVLVPGKIIKFLDDVLYRDQERFGIGFRGQSQVVKTPDNPVAPDVSVIVPQYLGICTPLEVDLTSSLGNGGRYFTNGNFSVNYEDSLNPNDALVLNQKLMELAADVPKGVLFFTIPYDAFGSSSNLVFTFQLTNFLGVTSQKVIQLYYDASKVIPSILIVGPSGGLAPRSSQVKLGGQVRFTANEACMISKGISASGGVSLTWNMLAPPEEVGYFDTKWITPSGAELNIPPYWFSLGVPLKYQLIVKLISTNQAYSLSYDLKYIAEPFAVDVAGGSKIVSNTGALPFDVTISDSAWADDSELSLHVSEYAVNWTCVFRTASGSEAPCPASIVLPKTKSFSLPAKNFPPTGTGVSNYLITVDVLHVPTGRRASNFAELRVLNSVIPKIALTSSRRKPLATDPTFALKATVLNADEFSSLKYYWISSPSCDGSSFATVDLSLPSNIVSKPNSEVLALRTKPPLLSGSTGYCIQVIVRDPTAPKSVFASSSIRFTTRKEPQGGSCKPLGSNTGVALSTEFKFRCGEWSTDARSGDLLYQYFMVKADGSRTALGQKGKSGIFTYIFGAAGTYNLLVEVTDDYGGVARNPATFTVTVTAGSADVDNFVSKSTQNFADSKNTADALKGVGAGSQGLNSQTSLRKRDSGSLQSSLIKYIEDLMSASLIDYNNVGPVFLNLMKSILSSGVPSTLLEQTTRMLHRLSVDMNKNGRDLRTCFNAETSSNVLSVLDVLVKTAETTPGFNATSVTSYIEPIFQAFVSCNQRVAVCGANPTTYQSASNQLTIGGLDPASSSLIAMGNVFVIQGLAQSVGTKPGECVSYRYDNGTNRLPDINGTIGNTVFILDFRNSTSNIGGLRRGETSTFKTPGADLMQIQFNPPINITLNIDQEFRPLIETGNFTPQCSFFKRSAEDMNVGYWDETGCQVLQFDTASVTCACTHLTEYAISISRVPSSVNTTPPDEPPTPASNVGAIAAGIAFVAAILGLVGFIAYKRVERKRTFDTHRVVPEETTGGDQTREEPTVVLEDTTVVDSAPPKLMKIRDPTRLPAYQLPPSYDEHLALKKASNDETKRQEKLNGLLKEQQMNDDTSSELP